MFYVDTLRPRALVILMLLVLGAAPPADAGCTYTIHNGFGFTDHLAFGTGIQADLFWANHYQARDGCDLLVSVDLLFGNNFIDGAPLEILIYDDLDDDGIFDQNTVLVSRTLSSVDALASLSLTHIPIDPVRVAGDFFVAALMPLSPVAGQIFFEQTQGQHRSFIAFNGADPGAFDPTNLNASTGGTNGQAPVNPEALTGPSPPVFGGDVDWVLTVFAEDGNGAAILVDPPAGLTTTEAGGEDQATIVLARAPLQDVTIALSSSLPSEGMVSPSSLLFTTANWETPQVVTATGVDDAVADGDQSFSVVIGAAVSGDSAFDGLDAPDVAAINRDDDDAGATVSPVSGLETTEAGASDTFTVVLDLPPTGDVTIALASSNLTEGTVDPASLVFTTANWSVPQTVTVTGADDLVGDLDRVFRIDTGSAVSTDPAYNGLDPADVTVTNRSVDAAIVVSPNGGLITTEAGTSDTFEVVLHSAPAADVTIALSSSLPGEGTPSPASLTFTPSDWPLPQTVTVTGADDAIADGRAVYTIVTAAAVSADPAYGGIDASDVGAINFDDDGPAVLVAPTRRLETSEDGGTATFDVVLNTVPSADVTVPLFSTIAAEGTPDSASLIFTTANWNVPQTVTVTGQDDAVMDGDRAYRIFHVPTTSTDPAYSGLRPPSVELINRDNDSPGIRVTPTGGLTTTEAGGTATFDVVLTAPPGAAVSLGLTSSDTTEGTVAPGSMTFSVANWNQPQMATVSGVNDGAMDGAVNYTIVTAAATSTDPEYSGRNAADIRVTNTDDEGVVGIATSSLPLAIEGSAYDQSLVGIGGTPPYSWAITAGSLPAGLILNPTSGTIQGIPTAVGIFNFTVQITDAALPANSGTRNLSLEVLPRLLFADGFESGNASAWSRIVP